VIYRPFRREVCANCFAYDRGRNWKLWACSNAVYFCSDDCLSMWRAHADPVTKDAWERVECWMKKAASEPEPTTANQGEPPTVAEIDEAWAAAEKTAQTIRLVATKSARRACQAVLNAPQSSDALTFLLSVVITAHTDPALYGETMLLVPASRPYRTPRLLHGHVSSFLTLLALLPDPLRAHVTAENLRGVVARDAHNSFGIWSIPEDDGAEMLGYGVWPNASFFNHSCSPTLVKDRVAREWRFITSRDVRESEELCISYIGENELKTMDTGERQAYLKHSWGFDCACTRCVRETREAQE